MKHGSFEHHFPSGLIFSLCIWNSLSLAGSLPAVCFQAELQCSPLLFHWPWCPLLPRSVVPVRRDLGLRIGFMSGSAPFLSSSFCDPVLVSVLELQKKVPPHSLRMQYTEGRRTPAPRCIEPWSGNWLYSLSQEALSPLISWTMHSLLVSFLQYDIHLLWLESFFSESRLLPLWDAAGPPEDRVIFPPLPGWLRGQRLMLQHLLATGEEKVAGTVKINHWNQKLFQTLLLPSACKSYDCAAQSHCQWLGPGT